MTYVYDIEIVINCSTFVFIDVNTPQELIQDYINADISKNITVKQEALDKIKHKEFIIFNETNNLISLINFLKRKDTTTLIGYNSFKYDNIIIDYILQNAAILSTYDAKRITHELYGISQDIIGYMKIGSYRKDFNVKYSNRYTSIDLMKLHGLDKSFISLKQVSIALKWYRVEDYTPPEITDAEIMKYGYVGKIEWYNRYVLNEHLTGLLDYNINDVLITYVLYHHGIDELKNRINTQLKYKVNVLSLSRSATADKLISKGYEEATGLNYWDYQDKRTYRRVIKFNELIIPNISFKTKELSEFLNNLKTKVIKVGVDNFKELIIFKGTGYTFAKGGLHSVDRPKEFKVKDTYIIDFDFDSYYPGFLISNSIKPKHLSHSIIDVLRHHRDIRVKAKKDGDKATADIGKIILNSVYGKLGFEYSFMYDLKAMYTVTINLQLILLMLVERLEMLNIPVISANTDGIVAIVPKDLHKLYKKTCIDLANEFKFSGEFTYYNKYIRTTVNDYITVKNDGKVKVKGDFTYDIQINKGYFAPVIAKVLYEYYVNENKNLNELVRQYDIYDYCISIKVGNQFISELHSIKNNQKHIEVLQKDNRYFVSNTGGVFLKHNVETNKYNNVIKGKYVTIFNTFYHSKDYNINYNWYLSKIRATINKINNIVTKDIKKISGGLFDSIEF